MCTHAEEVEFSHPIWHLEKLIRSPVLAVCDRQPLFCLAALYYPVEVVELGHVGTVSTFKNPSPLEAPLLLTIKCHNKITLMH